MTAFHIVAKIVLLKLLLACLSGRNGFNAAVYAYEYGYHPSAEEFDSLLRETRTWTRDLLANERPGVVRQHFVPKFNYEPQRDSTMRDTAVGASSQRKWWQANAQKLDRPPEIETITNLDFQLFSDETQPEMQQPAVFESVAADTAAHDTVHLQSDVLSFASNAGTKVAEVGEVARPTVAAGAVQLLNGSSKTTFPIFFSNPATGIVYAITQVGQVSTATATGGNDTTTTNYNETIPIYITKAQHDSELLALKHSYELNCRRKQRPHNMATTSRPHIIHLQQPNSVSKLPTIEQPVLTSIVHTQRPKPVQVNAPAILTLPHPTPMHHTKTATTARPTPPRRKVTQGHNKKQKKRKKPKPAGHKRRPAANHTLNGPPVILGTGTGTKQQLATQMEKPTPAMSATTATVFSQQLLPPMTTAGNMDFAAMQRKNVTSTSHTHRQRRALAAQQPASTLKHIDGLGSRRGKRRKTPKSATPASLPGPRVATRANKTLLVPNAWHLLRHKNATVSSKASNATALQITPLTSRSSKVGSAQNAQIGKKKAKRSRKRPARQNNGGFDLLDLVSVGSDEDDDDNEEEDDDDAEYDEYEDDYYYEEQVTHKTKPIQQKHKNRRKQVSAQGNDDRIDTITDLKEDTTFQDNSSSAEEGADFGAMEEDTIVQAYTTSTVQSVENTVDTTLSKTNLDKKRIRIRRRPPVAHSAESESDEEYDDESANDGDVGTGFGSFFRMIFYPMQVAMSRIFDGFGGQADDDTEDDETNQLNAAKHKYPTYTLYNNKHDSVENENDDEQAGIFGSWLSSWFGVNRKTKKISSTTMSPVTPAPPPPTPKPSWFESWLGYGQSNQPTSSEEDYNDDKWFFGWFDTKPKPKARRRTTTSTTTSTTPLPQVPILTIVDPLRNPQNWIGILAHHIINSTSTSTSTSTTTHGPLMEALTRVTSTTTENPEIPRRISYEKYQIWRLKPQDETQLRTLEEYKKSEDGVKLQWLKGPSLRGLTDVLVPPKMLVDFQGTLNFEAIAHEVLIFDVGKAIAYEQTKEDYLFTTPMAIKRPTKHKTNETTPPPPQRSQPPIMTWNKYYEYDDILKYLETIRMRHAQLVELIHIGRSYEGRPLVVVKIESKKLSTGAVSDGADGSRKRLKYKRKSGQANAVFIEAGAHGLAWIGPAVATWLISELLRLMRSNKSNPDTDFIRNTTWYIMPILNPDGYAYSHEYDRFWKKSRSRHVTKTPNGLLNSAMTWLQQRKSTEKVCFGVDIDRNWQYLWGKRGSSKSPCNEFYAGPTPFSEPETRALSEFLMDYRTQIKLYISLQAYGQVISYPIKANSTFNSERMDDFLDVAMVGTDGLRKKGSKTRYKVDSANDLIEHRSGCSDAFAAYEIGIPFSYTLQLADNGVHGYLLPSSSIESTARDAYEIITGMLDYI